MERPRSAVALLVRIHPESETRPCQFVAHTAADTALRMNQPARCLSAEEKRHHRVRSMETVRPWAEVHTGAVSPRASPRRIEFQICF